MKKNTLHSSAQKLPKVVSEGPAINEVIINTATKRFHKITCPMLKRCKKNCRSLDYTRVPKEYRACKHCGG